MYDTPTADSYTLSLHDALPISHFGGGRLRDSRADGVRAQRRDRSQRRTRCGKPAADGKRTHRMHQDRKSTRLNSSHITISYAVFCLKKKINHNNALTSHLNFIR